MELTVDRRKVTELSLALVVSCLANTFLLLSLMLTWKYWRQIKWYVLLLALGNWLEIAFRFGSELGWHLTTRWEGGSQFSCKFLMMMNVLGQSWAAMAVAAMALHVLLTVLTGSQGERVRHLLVLGLFLLLGLPLPLSRIPIFSLLPVPFLQDGSQQCVTWGFFESAQQEHYYTIGYCVALLYFPLCVCLGCGLAAAGLLAAADRERVKGEEHSSDVIITGLMGGILLVCCFPFYTFILVIYHKPYSEKVRDGLDCLEHFRNTLSALVTAGFAYLYVYGKREETMLTPTSTNATRGERQKLVNERAIGQLESRGTWYTDPSLVN